MEPRHRPIVRQLFRLVPLLFIGTLAIALAAVSWFGGREVEREVYTVMRPLAEALAVALSPSVETGDRVRLQRFVDRISANEAVSYVAVFDREGARLAATLGAEIVASIEQVDAILDFDSPFGVYRDGAFLYPISGSAYDVARRSSTVGVVLVKPGVEYFWLAYRSLALNTVLLMIVGVVAGVGQFYLGLRRLVIKPLKELTDAADGRDQAALAAIREHPGSREMDTLVGAILAMVGQIELKTEELEQAVEERTIELRRSMDELKRTQRMMVQQERLASIGRLSAGIAHEINNPAGFVKSNLETIREYLDLLQEAVFRDQLLSMELLSGNVDTAHRLASGNAGYLKRIDHEFVLSDSRSALEDSLTGMARISEIVRGLSGFAREDEPEDEEVDVAGAIDEAVGIVWSQLKDTVTLEREYRGEPKVRTTHGRLVQVFVNLLMNARQAMPSEGGHIAIRIDPGDSGTEIRVEDNGSGMPEHVRERIFDPFFTTKPIGSGTGLGLSIVHGIVEAAGGTIGVESTLGSGTVFTIRYPPPQSSDGGRRDDGTE